MGPFQQFFRLGVVSWEAQRANACREEHRDEGSRRNGDSYAESVSPTGATSTFTGTLIGKNVDMDTTSLTYLGLIVLVLLVTAAGIWWMGQ